jgi:hypothetical protein
MDRIVVGTGLDDEQVAALAYADVFQLSVSREELAGAIEVEFFGGELRHACVGGYAAARSGVCANRPEKRQRNGFRS